MENPPHMNVAYTRLTTILALCAASVVVAADATAGPVLLRDYQLQGSHVPGPGGNDVLASRGSLDPFAPGETRNVTDAPADSFGPIETTAGFVDIVMLWAGAMSPAEVAALRSPFHPDRDDWHPTPVSEVPEPSTLLLVCGGALLGLSSLLRRRA